MILDLDVGNSRLKWRVLSSTGPERQVMVRGIFDEISDIDLLANQLERPESVRVSCVRGPAFYSVIRNKVVSQWGIEPLFAESKAYACGVNNAYAVPQKLGIDRWLAIIAAYTSTKDAVVVIDAGSAITLDLVRSDGQHIGGYIVPGLTLQRLSLLDATAINDLVEKSWLSVDPGCSTDTAISNGILSMVTDWLVCRFRHSPDFERAQLLITGGDAAVISDQLFIRGIRHQMVPDLVLDGLSIALQQQPELE